MNRKQSFVQRHGIGRIHLEWLAQRRNIGLPVLGTAAPVGRRQSRNQRKGGREVRTAVRGHLWQRKNTTPRRFLSSGEGTESRRIEKVFSFGEHRPMKEEGVGTEKRRRGDSIWVLGCFSRDGGLSTGMWMTRLYGPKPAARDSGEAPRGSSR